MAMAKLEKEVGVTLFDRKPRGIELTPAGEYLHHAGQRLLADHIIAMSPDDRARFADRLEAMMARGGQTNPRPAPPE
jgi:DNA-binding transcriptional LysR family regulator